MLPRKEQGKMTANAYVISKIARNQFLPTVEQPYIGEFFKNIF